MNKIDAKGLYDPGANITLIPRKAYKKLNINNYTPNALSFKTMSGEDRIRGLSSIELEIFDMKKPFYAAIVDRENFDYDILIGLDAIKEFRLCQDHNLNITQASEKMNETDSRGAEGILVNWNESVPVEKFEMKVAHLDDSQKKIIHDLVDRHSTVFAKNTYDIGTVSEYEAHIKLAENRYVTRKPYRCTYEDQQEIEKQITELLNHNMIEQSCSPFASPVTLAYKKTGEGSVKEKNRLCVDFRDLNKLLIPESQPFPLIDDILTRTRNCKWFSALDINMAFWSIPIRSKDRYKTGFVTQHGHWQWKSLPFGLKNSPAIFQRILSGIIRRNKLEPFCCNYIDDILIFSETFDEHVKHLDRLMTAIRTEGFKLKFIKCSFANNSVRYLGHEIKENEVKPLNDNLVAIKAFPRPQNCKNVRQFLGKINFYHKYIPNAAKNLDVFHNLLRKNVEFSWTTECEETFRKIKDYLTSAPILAIFDRNLPIHIYTDASGEGVAAVLKQIQTDGSEKPVAFFSKKLNEAQKKKKAIYIESYAVREAVRYWRYWLLGRKFKIITDHKPLQDLNLKSRTDEELGDIANYLLQYDFDIVYQPGSQNAEADCLSRNPVLPSDFNPDPCEPLRTVNVLKLEDIQISQNRLPASFKRETENGIAIRTDKKKKRVILDEEYGRKLVALVHTKFGHIGSRQVINSIKDHYYFRNMYKTIFNLCRSCEICIKNKSRRERESGFLGHLGPASEPFECMSIDTAGGFGGRRSTKRYLHILVDHFTRFAFISTTAGQSASDFIRLIDSVHRENRIGTLLTDQYGGLTAKELENYLQEKKIDRLFTAVDHPASNGLNERLNQTLVNRIRCKINESDKIAWATIARRCVDEYNNTVHSSTGYTPNYLLNGIVNKMTPLAPLRLPDLPADRLRAFENSQRSHAQNKKRHDSKKGSRIFGVGDRVYIENGNRLNRHKLDEIRIGPFPISRKLSNTVCEIDVGHQKPDLRKYHVSKLIASTPGAYFGGGM